MGTLNWAKQACFALLLCATTVIALPAQTFTAPQSGSIAPVVPNETIALSSTSEKIQRRDVVTREDPLPAAVVVDPMGYVLERETRITLVESETHDDN